VNYGDHSRSPGNYEKALQAFKFVPKPSSELLTQTFKKRWREKTKVRNLE
jgi:hypothetical protein